MLVFDIKIIPWSYFYVTFNCSYKFVHFSPVNFMLISLMILTLYVCLHYCQKLINFYWKSGQCVWCHAMYLYKKICCSNTWIFLFANKKSLPLYAYICPCKLVLKGLKNFFLILLELSFIGKMCDGWWNVCNLCYSTWLSSSSCSAVAHNWWATFRTLWGESGDW